MIERLEFRETVDNQKQALELLTKYIPKLPYEETLQIDFRGKDYWRYKRGWGDDVSMNVKRAYYYRVVAARNFERLAEEIPSLKNKILEEAAFSYDRAAKNAEWVGFLMATIRCRIRSCKLFHRLQDKVSRDIAADHIVKIISGSSYEELMKD